jgi:hypothetical protein
MEASNEEIDNQRGRALLKVHNCTAPVDELEKQIKRLAMGFEAFGSYLKTNGVSIVGAEDRYSHLDAKVAFALAAKLQQGRLELADAVAQQKSVFKQT